MSAGDDAAGTDAEAAAREVLMGIIEEVVAAIEPASETFKDMVDTTRDGDHNMADGMGGDDTGEESSSDNENQDSSDSDSSEDGDDSISGDTVKNDGVEDEDDGDILSMILDNDIQPFSPPRTHNEDYRPPLCRPEPISDDEELRLLGEVAHIILNDLTVTIGPVQGEDVIDRETTLCLEDRTVVGAVDDVIGNVQTPTYVVRFESEAAIRSLGIAKGVGIWVPVRSKKLVNVKQLEEDRRARRNPVDVSGDNDEMDDQEQYFSSDEAERAWRKEHDQSRRSQGRGRGNGRRDGSRGQGGRGRDRGRGRGGRGGRGYGGRGRGDRNGRGDRSSFSDRDRPGMGSAAYEPDYNPIRRPQFLGLPPKPPAPVDGGSFNPSFGQSGFRDRGYGDRGYGGGQDSSGRREDSRSGQYSQYSQYNQASQDTPNYAASRVPSQDHSNNYHAAGGRYTPSQSAQPPSNNPHMPPPPFGAVSHLPKPSASGAVPMPPAPLFGYTPYPSSAYVTLPPPFYAGQMYMPPPPPPPPPPQHQPRN